MRTNHSFFSSIKKLTSAIISLCIWIVFVGCSSDFFEGCGLQGRRSAPIPPRPVLTDVITTVSVNQISVRQNESISVDIDVTSVGDVSVTNFSTGFSENIGISITKSSCSSSEATSACQEWTFTPAINAIPGIYEVIVKPTTVTENTNTINASIQLTVINNNDQNSAPAAIQIFGNDGIWHIMTSDQNRWSWANSNTSSNTFGAAGVGGYYEDDINAVNPFIVNIAAKHDSQSFWTDFTGNSGHGIAVDSEGDVYTWGENTSALGFGSSEPIPIPRLLTNISNVSKVATSSNSSFAIINGEVMGWGSNFEGIRGVGNSLDPWRTEFEIVNNITDAIQLAAGDNHMLALSSDGQVWSWGSNGMGQQGNGNIGAFSVTVSTINSLTDIVQIAASGDFSLALRDDGTVWAWGSNRLGQLGVNSAEVSIPTPTQVVGLNNVRAIAASTIDRLPYSFAIDFAPINNITQSRPYRWGGGSASPQLIDAQAAYSVGSGYFTDYNCGLVALADGTQTRAGFLWDIRDLTSPIPKLVSFFGKNDPTCRNKLFLHALPTEGGSISTSPDGGQSFEYDTATEVALTVVANSGWEINTITPWSGNEDCDDGIVTVQGGVQCIANFVRNDSHLLTVSKLGNGDGNITSNPSGLDCGLICDELFAPNTQVILTATADANSTFVNWSGSGDCLSPTILVDGSASITLTQDSECTATFEPISTGETTLTVIINGSGSVDSSESPVPIMMCLNSVEESITCTVSYPIDSSVTLVAEAFFPSNTLLVSGCDSFVGANPDCFVTMNEDKTVIYDIPISPQYDISATITGNGSIISFASGGEVGVTGRIECPSVNCDDTFVVPASAPTIVTFEGHPDAGSTFVSFGVNQCDSERVTNGVGICNVDLVPGSASVRQVDATFQ